MPKCYLVLGPESSGNRLLTRIIASCYGIVGDGAHHQRLDDLSFQRKTIKDERDVVFLRSLPHAHRWPNLKEELFNFIAAKYEIVTFILTRDWQASAQSQVSISHVDTEEQAFKNIQIAYCHALDQVRLINSQFYFVSYESMILDPSFASRFCSHYQIGIPDFKEKIKDENAKWLGY